MEDMKEIETKTSDFLTKLDSDLQDHLQEFDEGISDVIEIE